MSAEDAVSYMKVLREKYRTKHVCCDTLKLIADGTVEEHTALLFSAYADEPDNYGSELLGEEDMARAASLAAKEGFSVHIHAIGDKAVNRALTVLVGLGSISGTKTIAHNQLYSKDDKQRIAANGDIFFQTTPHWAKRDAFTLQSIGQERYEAQFPIGTMMKRQVPVTFGSDSCLEERTANAFLGMYEAIVSGDTAPDRESCLLAYTLRGARQLKADGVTGSICEGKSADFVVLDRDVMQCAPEEMKETTVLRTYFEGEMVYGE
ncbi:MAG: amidohydrolase family protein [Lachnospiraceae bacterium]|nr:amidohydrolase family protein [Lachnospiraceae bacterium]